MRKIHASVLLCLTLLLPGDVAGSVDIASKTELEQNSDVSSAGWYILNPGAFNITGAVNINSDSRSGLRIDNANTTLNVANTLASGNLLTLRNFDVRAGNVSITGGSASTARGVYAYGTAISGGSTYSYGGSGYAAFGLATIRDGLAVNGGYLYAQGGGGQSSDGVRVQSGGLNVSGGQIDAHAGAGYLSYGMYVVNGGFTLSGTGVVNAYGSNTYHNMSGILLNSGFYQYGGALNAFAGTYNNSLGMYVDSGLFDQYAGAMAAVGGSGAYSIGIKSDEALRQFGGRVDATGGTGLGSYGMYVPSVVQEAGAGASFIARGGNANSNSVGLYTTAFTQNGGTLEGRGGDAAGATGAFVDGPLYQARGVINAFGGAGPGSHGIFADSVRQDNGEIAAAGGSSGGSALTAGLMTNDLVQNGGSITAGGGGVGAHGIYAGTFQQSAGQLVATGGASGSNGSTGLTTNSLTQNNGSITASGGAGIAAHGVYAGTFQQSAGQLVATGGASGSNGSTGLTTNSLTQNDGSITASGGAGIAAHGVYAGTFQQSAGQLVATGGISGSNGSTGLTTNSLTQNNGSITASGGAGIAAHGIFAGSVLHGGGDFFAVGGAAGSTNAIGLATDSLTQNYGFLNANGGTGDGGHGIYAATLRQNAGDIFAAGGNYNGTVTTAGLAVDNLSQTSGAINAIGGVYANNPGLYVTNSAAIAGTLRLERDGLAPSVLSTGSGFTLSSGSVLEPVVNILGTNPDTGSGLIAAYDPAANAPGVITIEQGARLAPWFVENRSMRRGVVYSSYVFMDTHGGAINGAFANDHGGVTIVYNIEKTADGKYIIFFEREQNLIDVVSLLPCENTRSLLSVFDSLLDGDPLNPTMSRVIAYLDHSQDLAEFYAQAEHIGKSLTPQAYTKLTHTLRRTMDLPQADIRQAMRRQTRWLRQREDNFAAGGALGNAASGFPAGGWSAWGSPLYQKSTRFAPKCFEFDDAKERMTGGAVGMMRSLSKLTVAGSLFWVNSEYTADYSDIEADSYGFMLGGRLDDIVPRDDWLAPWLEVTCGYSHGDVSQRTLDYDYKTWNLSEPNAKIFRAGATLANDMRLGRRLSVTPTLGVDYTRIRQSGFRAQGQTQNRLDVRGGSLHSAQGRIGFETEVRATPELSLTGKALYRREFGDVRSRFAYNVVSCPGTLLTEWGERRTRHGAELGLGVGFRPNDTVRFDAGYDWLAEDGYRAHRFSAGVAISF